MSLGGNEAPLTLNLSSQRTGDCDGVVHIATWEYGNEEKRPDQKVFPFSHRVCSSCCSLMVFIKCHGRQYTDIRLGIETHALVRKRILPRHSQISVQVDKPCNVYPGGLPD